MNNRNVASGCSWENGHINKGTKSATGLCLATMETGWKSLLQIVAYRYVTTNLQHYNTVHHKLHYGVLLWGKKKKTLRHESIKCSMSYMNETSCRENVFYNINKYTELQLEQ